MTNWNLSGIEERPGTVDEVVERLMLVLDEDDKVLVRDRSKDDLFALHFGLGLEIRNAFGLHGRNPTLIESCGCSDPDDASMVIIEALWRTLRQERQSDF